MRSAVSTGHRTRLDKPPERLRTKEWAAMKKWPLTPLGVAIKNRLNELGKTQAELAAEVGTSSNYLYLVMTGIRSGRTYMPKLAKALEMKVEKLQVMA
jgi:Helix-turn-helix